jgi:modulator of FtsH protease
MNSPTLINARGQVIAQAEPALLSRVLGIASLGFLVTAAGVYFAPPFFSGPMLLVCVVASFALIFGVRATRANAVLSLSLFLGLAFVLGFEISPWMRMLIGSGHSNVIFNAAMTTGVGMGMLGIGAQFANFNYRRVGGIASAALLGLVAVGILSMFFHFIQPGVYSVLTLIIFSVLVIVDFMRIRSGGDGRTAVELALSIYLDGLNIFLALTRLFRGGRD